MKTIYINGLMQERCGVFLGMLARRFQVALPGWQVPPRPGLHFIDSLEAIGQLTAEELSRHAHRVLQETRNLTGSLAADLAACGICPDARWQPPAAVVESRLMPVVKRVLGEDLAFRRFHELHPVDMVISGSDYGSHSRVVTLAAQELGIPTLNLEHGFFFNRFDQDRIEGKEVLPTVFTSDFANLDNALEAEGFAREAQGRATPGPEFLTLGTPVQTVAGTCPDPEAALATLGLDGARQHVLLLGSWIEARAVNSVVQGQLDTIAAYEDLLRSLAESGLGEQITLLIKLHPVDSAPDVYPGVKAALEQLAVGFGLPAPAVFRDRLPELLAAADVIVSLGFSSVLFEAFQLGKPSVVRLLPYLAPSRRPGWQVDASIPLREGVMTAVESGAEVWSEVGACLTPARQVELAQARQLLLQKYGLDFPTVEQKSERIIDWIENHLAG